MTEAAASSPSGGRVEGVALRGPVRLLPDERLARRAAGGDERAFAEIFRRYHQDLYRFCLATLSNPQDAQEALQNTMVKVMRALPGEQRAIKLKPWLYRIARNEAVETLRRRRGSTELEDAQLAAPWEITETAAARARLRDLLADLDALPERQRAALVMRELGGLDFDEIGESFGTTPAAARQTLYEARQSLRQMEEGREMACESVRRSLSDADGRVTRRRDVRAHLRDCPGCRAFRDGIAERRANLAAISPLPAVVSAGVLQGLLGGQAASLAAGAGATVGAGGAVGTIGVGAGKAVATTALVKSAATVAVVAVGIGAADRGGVIDVPVVGGGGSASSNQAPQRLPGAVDERGDATGMPSSAAAGQGSEGGRGAGPGAAADAGRAAPGAKGKGSPPAPSSAKRRGHSRGQPNHRGRPAGHPQGGGPAQGMPAASNRGQQTAASRKPQAGAPPAPSSGATDNAPAAAPPSALPKAEGAPAAPPVTEAAPPPPAPEAKAEGAPVGGAAQAPGA